MQRRIECMVPCPKTDGHIFVKKCYWCEHNLGIKKLRFGCEVICDYEQNQNKQEEDVAGAQEPMA